MKTISLSLLLLYCTCFIPVVAQDETQSTADLSLTVQDKRTADPSWEPPIAVMLPESATTLANSIGVYVNTEGLTEEEAKLARGYANLLVSELAKQDDLSLLERLDFSTISEEHELSQNLVSEDTKVRNNIKKEAVAVRIQLNLKEGTATHHIESKQGAKTLLLSGLTNESLDITAIEVDHFKQAATLIAQEVVTIHESWQKMVPTAETAIVGPGEVIKRFYAHLEAQQFEEAAQLYNIGHLSKEKQEEWQLALWFARGKIEEEGGSYTVKVLNVDHPSPTNAHVTFSVGGAEAEKAALIQVTTATGGKAWRISINQ